MINSILFMVLGAILAISALFVAVNYFSNKMAKEGRFASARFDVKAQEWRVIGKFGGIAQKLSDIRAGRQPGAIKYVD